MEDVHLSGWLVKRASKSGRGWKRRFFVLDGTSLCYFRAEGETKARGELRVTANTFVRASHYKPHCLELATNRQVLVICADSVEMQAEWLAAIEQAIRLARHQQQRELQMQAAEQQQQQQQQQQTQRRQQQLQQRASVAEDAGRGKTARREGDLREFQQEEESKTSSTGHSYASGIFKRLKHRRRSSTASSTGGCRDGMAGMDIAETGAAAGNDSMARERTGSHYEDAMEVDFSSGGFGDAAAETLPRRRPRHRFSTPATTFDVDARYSLIRPVGTGAYGVVVSAQDREDGEEVAIKKVTRAFEDLVDAKRILREIKLLRHFDHENIIHIKDLQPPRGYSDFEDIYIVSELMETDLHRVIYSKQQLTEDHVQYFVYQTLRALKYIHSANVIHRDLKPSNLLLNSNCDLKVCDFGLARGLEDTQLELTEYVVTRWYRAPEIMLACREYTKAIDVWAVGCILAELLARKPLFPGEDYIHQLQLITDLLGSPSEADMAFIRSDKAKRFMRNLPVRRSADLASKYPDASAACLDLLQQMLHFNPKKRITVDDALRHPYLASLHQPDDEPECPSLFLFDDNCPDKLLRKRDLQDQILQEVLHFHPEERGHLEREAAASRERSQYL